MIDPLINIIIPAVIMILMILSFAWLTYTDRR